TWDVAMNVQGAAVERALRRAVMPKYHAGWSIGTVAGAAAGAAMVVLGVPVTPDLLSVAAALLVPVPATTRHLLPASPGQAALDPAARRSPLVGWTEPRTLLIGVFVLCMAFSEGTGNDWLGLAVIGGYHTAPAVGTLPLAIFLAAMTTGRWFGPRLL